MGTRSVEGGAKHSVGERRAGRIPERGSGWNGVVDEVDDMAMELLTGNRLPGVAVAATKGRQLVLAKGYGYALDEDWAQVPMGPWTRINIGSVTKAAVTGPAVWQVLREKDLDPSQTRLYGPRGLFEGTFDADIDIGIRRGMEAGEAQATQWREWYRRITVQHLFDHRSGFTRGGDGRAAAALFGVPFEDRTHEQVHRHFLRTRPLLHEPGSRSAYSNHGFGLLALVIEQLTDSTFEEYVREAYLKPRGLYDGVRPSRKHLDSHDAHRYRPSARGQTLVPSGDSAHAAGGYVASMEGLARLMRQLHDEYTGDELDRMGWGRNSTGRLAHNGLLGKGGGTAYAVMYPDGYVSKVGVDLSEVHVCVATNTKTNVGDVEKLGRAVAALVGESAVPTSFDLWTRGRPSAPCEYCRKGVRNTDYQVVFEAAVAAGYRLEWIDAYSHRGVVRFNVVFRPDDGSEAWVSHHAMSAAAYQRRFDRYADEGYSLTHVDSYGSKGRVRYAAIWRKTGEAFTAYHGLPAAEHQKRFESLVRDGWRPTVISVVARKRGREFTALYTKRSLGSFVARSSLSPERYQAAFDKNAAAGRHLVYLNSYVERGEPRFTAIWAEKPPVSGVRATHGLRRRRYPSAYWTAIGDGLQTRAITGYSVGKSPRIAAYWTS